MAWLQNLAGKAEDLLNKIDQNAATVLNEAKIDQNATLIHEATKTLDNEITNFIDMQPENDGNSRRYICKSGPVTIEFVPIPESKNADTPIELFKPIAENILEDTFTKNDNVSISSHHGSFVITQEIESLQEKIVKMEIENQDMCKQLLNLQHLYSEIRNENLNYQIQLERANEQLSNAQIEKDQYVARAQRILQEKEKLISHQTENVSPEDTGSIFATYHDELKKELEFQQQKNQELNEKLTRMMKDMHSLQSQHHVVQNGLHQANQTLEQQLLNEKKLKSAIEEECVQKSKELQLKHHDINNLHQIINNKENEIQQLQQAVKQKPTNTAPEDYEYRINVLTHTLMVKQNNLETLTTERNALRLQVEKLENEYKKKILQLTGDKVNVVHIHDSSDDNLPLPKFMRVSPLDAGVTRRVKRAYSSLDAISIRTGVFLRRYPVARVFVMCYIVLLHLWVLCVLFLYVPSNK